MSKPRLLDLFCGAGGAAVGYHRAGFEVVGVDIAPQKHYPFAFHQADALTFPLDGFDVIHASPPCQAYSNARHRGKNYPDLLPAMRERLLAQRAPWVIENVVGAPMWQGVMLCGSMFGLQVIRHRLFDSSEWLYPPCGCDHRGEFYSVIGHSSFPSHQGYGMRDTCVSAAVARRAMGIDWMPHTALSQAIPPAYTQWIGLQLLAALDAGKVA